MGLDCFDIPQPFTNFLNILIFLLKSVLLIGTQGLNIEARKDPLYND